MIVCVGQAAWDVVLPIHQPLIENQKYRIYDSSESIGAPACNAAALLGKWNEPVRFIGRVGKDGAGEKILKTLSSLQVDISSVYIDECFTTPISYIVVNQQNASRTIFNLPGQLSEFKLDHQDKHGDVILFDGHDLDASRQVLKCYPEAITMLDGGSYNEVTDELARVVDYVVCSADFARQCLNQTIHDIKQGYEAYHKLKKIYSGQIILTLGELGCIYEDELGIHHLPAYQVDAIDTTGAGDIFHGAFAYGLAHKMSLAVNCRFSSTVAGISVTRLGAYTSIPSLDEVLKLFSIT